MTKDELKGWLFGILNENGSIFKVSLNETLDILQVETLRGQSYTIRVEDFDNTAKKKVKESYAVLSLSMSVLGLFDLGVIDNKKAKKYLAKLSQCIGDVEI